MKCLIIAGGSIDFDQLKSIYKKMSDTSVYVITCDRGTMYALEAGIPVDKAIGDFDSVSKEEYEDIRVKVISDSGEEAIEKLIPEKDDTDSEHAIRYAISLRPEEIIIMGATGSRLDHTFSVINMLKLCFEQNVPACIIDKNNRIRVLKGEFVFEKKNIYGKYISLIPYGEDAFIESISGFKYEIENTLLPKAAGLGVSNELSQEKGVIKTRDYVIVFESKD